MSITRSKKNMIKEIFITQQGARKNQVILKQGIKQMAWVDRVENC